MGFFDFLSSGEDTAYGYKTFKNTYGLDNEKMLKHTEVRLDTCFRKRKTGHCV